MSHAVHSVTHAVSKGWHKLTHGVEHLGKEIVRHPIETIGIGAAAFTGGSSLGLFGGSTAASGISAAGSMADTALGASSVAGATTAASTGLSLGSLGSAIDTGGKIAGGLNTVMGLTRSTPKIDMPQAPTPTQPTQTPQPVGSIDTSQSLGDGLGDLFKMTKTKYSKNSYAPTTRYGLGSFTGLS